jgi:hypothetical protein
VAASRPFECLEFYLRGKEPSTASIAIPSYTGQTSDSLAIYGYAIENITVYKFSRAVIDYDALRVSIDVDEQALRAAAIFPGGGFGSSY